MARPHICFIQAQILPWQPGLPGGNRPGVDSKTLSRDDSDGSATLIVRYPAGWGLAAAEYLTAHEEFLVLEGAIEINGRRYDTHTYGFLPAGYRRASASSSSGAVLLTMFYGAPLARSGEAPAGLYEPLAPFFHEAFLS